MESLIAEHNLDLATDISLAYCVAVLDARRVLVCEELQSRSHANAACDVDFNTLLAERSALSQALSSLTPLARHEAYIPHPRD
jgi:hypothetical protein